MPPEFSILAGPITTAPARTMADIAALFLTGARPIDPNRPTPIRRPPGQPAAPESPAPAAPLPHVPQPSAISPHPSVLIPQPSSLSPGDLSDLDRWPICQFILAPHPSLAATLDQLRIHLAGYADQIGLILFDRHELSIQRLVSPDADQRDIPHTGAPDLRLARALRLIGESVTHWLILPATLDHPLPRTLLPQLPNALLISEAPADQMVAAYRHAKSALTTLGDWTGQLRLIVAAENPADRAETTSRLQQVCAEFLKRTVLPLPVSPVGPAEWQPLFAMRLDSQDGAELTDQTADLLTHALLDFFTRVPGEEGDIENAATSVTHPLQPAEAHEAAEIPAPPAAAPIHRIAPAPHAPHPTAPSTDVVPEAHPAALRFNDAPPPPHSPLDRVSPPAPSALEADEIQIIDIPLNAPVDAFWCALTAAYAEIHATPAQHIPAITSAHAIFAAPAATHAWLHFNNAHPFDWLTLWQSIESAHGATAGPAIHLHLILLPPMPPFTVPTALRQFITFYTPTPARIAARKATALIPKTT